MGLLLGSAAMMATILLACRFPAVDALCVTTYTKEGCLNYPTTCYWCTSSCTSFYSSTCMSSRTCASASRDNCTTSNDTINCGYCSNPGMGYRFCQYSSNGSMPAECSSGWTPHGSTLPPGFTSPSTSAPSTSAPSTSSAAPTSSPPPSTSTPKPSTTTAAPTTSVASSTSAPSSTSAAPSSACASYSASSTCKSTSSSCGWCTYPSSGYSSCQSSTSYKPSGCSSGWSPSTYNSGGTCSTYISESTCTAVSYCGWCTTPSGTNSNCQTGYTSMPSTCSSGWSAPSSSGAVAAAVGMAVGLMIFVIVAPIVCCLCIIGIIVYLVCRKPATNTVVVSGEMQQKQPQAYIQGYPQPAQGSYVAYPSETL